MSDKDKFLQSLDNFFESTFTYNKDKINLMFTYEIFTDRYSTIVIANNMADAINIVFSDDPKAVILCAVDVMYRDEFLFTK